MAVAGVGDHFHGPLFRAFRAALENRAIAASGAGIAFGAGIVQRPAARPWRCRPPAETQRSRRAIAWQRLSRQQGRSRWTQHELQTDLAARVAVVFGDLGSQLASR